MNKLSPFYIILTLLIWSISIDARASNRGFYEQCIGTSSNELTQISCTVDKDEARSILKIEIINLKATVQATGRFGNGQEILSVIKSERVSPQITELGVVDESIKITAINRSKILTLTLPCGQRAYGILKYGSKKDAAYLTDTITQCDFKILPAQ
ncbi:MAG: hypothetical protein SGI74_04740 [Oligoflexia bacterium]|nr:hypothetical protein [Oligoflexia bacterium]